MTSTPNFRLNDGTEIPPIGFGTFRIPADGSTYRAVTEALSRGYRHIDTATAYFNEQEVGQAIKDSGVPRDQIWVTSKLWLQDHEYEDAKAAIDRSLEKLGLDYLDLYLMHQPFGAVDEAWRALEEAQKAGKVRSIGVPNMTPKLWKKWVPDFDVKPSVNQIEFNPYVQQVDIRALMARTQTVLEAWGPLGQGDQELLSEPVLYELADKYGKDVGQIILRFEHQEGAVVLPKSIQPERIQSNQEIFDFTLTSNEMDSIRALDTASATVNPDAPGYADGLLAILDVHGQDN